MKFYDETENNEKQLYKINKYNAKERYAYQNFHNLYIKEKLLRNVSPSILNGSNKMSGRLVDFGSGKGGDITKWKRAKLAEVIGIEYDIKNIELCGYISIQLCFIQKMSKCQKITQKPIFFMNVSSNLV